MTDTPLGPDQVTGATPDNAIRDAERADGQKDGPMIAADGTPSVRLLAPVCGVWMEKDAIDFTNAATDAPGVKTAYQVGKGLTAHVEKLAREALGTDADDPQVAVADDTAEAEEAAALTPETTATAGTTAAERREDQPQATASVDAAHPIEAPTQRPRRMRFAFDDTATHGEQQTA